MTLMGWVLKMEETLYDFLICSLAPCNVRTSLNLKKGGFDVDSEPGGLKCERHIVGCTG